MISRASYRILRLPLPLPRQHSYSSPTSGIVARLCSFPPGTGRVFITCRSSSSSSTASSSSTTSSTASSTTSPQPPTTDSPSIPESKPQHPQKQQKQKQQPPSSSIPPSASLLFNRRITSDHRQWGGVLPAHAVEGHTASLAPLLASALAHLPPHDPATATKPPLTDPSGTLRRRPDFVSVTRGPGMGASLAVGLNSAKALAAAWGVPLVGVHHMQAHALTPRLVSALEAGRHSGGAPDNSPQQLKPSFPFATLLVSGGHTMLLSSTSLLDHRVLAEADSIAIGDALDKAARNVLPSFALSGSPDTSYARVLEEFAFPGSTSLSPAPVSGRYAGYNYDPPRSRTDEDKPVTHKHYDWTLSPPLAGTRRMAFNYSGLGGQIKKLVVQRAASPEGEMGVDERRVLAQCVMRVAFEHLASRVLMMLQERDPRSKFYYQQVETRRERDARLLLAPGERARLEAEMAPVNTLVVSGGVASNKYLLHVLRRFLQERGYPHVRITAPPPEHCTDNAAMIAWAGMEMFEAGYTSDLSILATTQWPMDARVDGGGIVEVGGWQKREDGKHEGRSVDKY